MKNIDCTKAEKYFLLSGDNDTKKNHYCPVEAIIFIVLFSACIALLIFIHSKNSFNYLTQSSKNNENIINNLKKTEHLDGKGIFSRVVSSHKKEDFDECKKTLALKNDSKHLQNTRFWHGSVYFIKDDGIITDQEACAVESVLHKYPKNHTHLIELLCNRPRELIQGTDFIKLLHENYGNFKTTSIKGNDFFKNSPVQGIWKCDDSIALFEAKLLTLWLYGGAVMSFEVLFNTPDILNYDGLYLSPYVMVSNKNCHSFLFKILNKLKSTKRKNVVNVFKKEIIKHNEMNGSSLVKLLDNDQSICDHFSSVCPFLLTEELKKKTAAWTVSLANFCPIIIKQFMT